MEILDREEVFCPLFDPDFFPESLALGAVAVPAGVLRYLDRPAFGALVLMSAQLRRSAYFSPPFPFFVIDLRFIRPLQRPNFLKR